MARKSNHKKVGKTQTFSITAPEARSVLLVGDFTEWEKQPVSLHKKKDGLWRATVELEPGEHRYRFLVDGEWRDDPACGMWIQNPYGSEDAVRTVS